MIRVFSWLNNHPLLWDVSHHPFNEGKRSPRQGALLKRMGLIKGTLDIYILYPTIKYHGLIIELKEKSLTTGRWGRSTDEQVRKVKRLNELGYFAAFTFGYDDTIKTIEDYLEGKL